MFPAPPPIMKRETGCVATKFAPVAMHLNEAVRREWVSRDMVYPNVKDRVSVPTGTPDKTLFVCVDETYGKGLCDPPKSGRRVSLEDCARGYWTEANLSASRGYDCEWLMARAKSKIVGVWKIDRKHGWMVPSATPKATWPSDKPTPPPQRRG